MKTLQLVNQIKGSVIDATDGAAGKLDELYFDDRSWKIIYAVATLGHGKKVLLSSLQFDRYDPEIHALSVLLSRDEVKNCPDIDSDLPVDRQNQKKYYSNFSWPFFLLGDSLANIQLPEENEFEGNLNVKNSSGKPYDPHLRSTNNLTNINVSGNDGNVIGKAHDFALDIERWSIPFVVVKVHGAKMVLCNPSSIAGVDYEENKIVTNLTFEKIHALPVFDQAHPTILCVDSLREIEEPAVFNR